VHARLLPLFLTPPWGYVWKPLELILDLGYHLGKLGFVSMLAHSSDCFGLWAIQLLWVSSHLDDPDQVKSKALAITFFAEHGVWNLAAESLAESGALHIQVPVSVANHVKRFFYLTRLLQLRLIAIIMAMPYRAKGTAISNNKNEPIVVDSIQVLRASSSHATQLRGQAFTLPWLCSQNSFKASQRFACHLVSQALHDSPYEQ